MKAYIKITIWISLIAGGIIIMGGARGTAKQTSAIKEEIKDIGIIYYLNESGEYENDLFLRLNDDLELVNNLCKKLDLNYKFYFHSSVSQDFNNYGELDYGNETIDSNQEDPVDYFFYLDRNSHKEQVKIYLDYNDDLGYNPCYKIDRRYIRMPYSDRHNVSIQLHEMIHKLLAGISEIGSHHMEGNKIRGLCKMDRDLDCINLMSRDYTSPFNFFVTEAQKELINKLENKWDPDKPCSHKYPKELLRSGRNNVEDNIDCCGELVHVDDELKRQVIIGISDHQIEVLNSIVEFMISESVCPYSLDPIQVEAIAQRYMATITFIESQYPFEPPLNAKDSISVYRSIRDINLLYQHHYKNSDKFLKLLNRCAKFLVKGTSVSEDYVFDSYYMSIDYRLSKKQERIDEWAIEKELEHIGPEENGAVFMRNLIMELDVAILTIEKLKLESGLSRKELKKYNESIRELKKERTILWKLLYERYDVQKPKDKVFSPETSSNEK